ncbi:MAG: AEC family transporter [Clostridia bacterium]|nr:AEC family transporter [Clostridia bacterium]
MEIFNLTLVQTLSMFILIIAGFVLRKINILPDGSDRILSKLETYLLCPALSLANQITNCNIKSFSENAPLMFYGLGLAVAAILLSYPLSRLFAKGWKTSPDIAYQRQIYKYALVFGNYGYVGNFLVLGIWGDEAFYKYSIFTFLLGLLCYAWGISILVPKGEGNSPLKNLKKGLLNPPFIALLIGMFLGLTGLGKYVPGFAMTAFKNAGNCMGPVAMILAGVVMGGYNFKELISNKKVYITTILRLIVLPSLFVIPLKLLGASEDAIIFAFIAFAAPIGMNTIIYPATYGGDTKTGASMTMISSVLSVITIPIMYYLIEVVL